jgi:hypothetical protein
MQRFGVWLGVSAMFFALFAGPFFHLHDRDDHGDAASVVHAHLLEAEEPEHHHPDDEIETSHSHARARWVDAFTFNVPSPVFELAGDFSETLSILLEEGRKEIAYTSAPRAHGPPGARLSSLRSPPTV